MTARNKTRPGLLADGALSAWRWRAQAASAALVTGAVILLASAAQAALSACPAPPPNEQIIVSLKQCCRITKPGDYALQGNLTGSGGACIKIVASGVTLDGSGYQLTGNGTGVGIRLLPSARGDVVSGIADISDFKTGILDDAPRSVIAGIPTAHVSVEQNTGNGIVIRANRVYLASIDSDNNEGNGVVVKPLAPASVVANVYLGFVNASNNAKAGFLLKSLSGLLDRSSHSEDNGADGADLINSVKSSIAILTSDGNAGDGAALTDCVSSHLTDTNSYGNNGDGVKVVGGHGDVLDDQYLGFDPSGSAFPNEIGLEVRNSAFDTIDNTQVKYNTGDGLLIVNGNGESLRRVISAYNGSAGIHLKRTSSSGVTFDSDVYNGGAGIWLDGSQGITVDELGSEHNTKSNVYIGCSSAQEPDGTRCADVGRPASNGNRVVQSQFSSAPTETDVGIGIDRGNHHNQVLQNTATGNTTDAVDMNTNCDSNQWVLNTFEKTLPAQPSCIQ